MRLPNLINPNSLKPNRRMGTRVIGMGDWLVAKVIGKRGMGAIEVPTRVK